MSADGEIEVSVRAEGADEAAGELAGGDGDGGGGPDAPDGDGGGGGGRFGKLLSRIAGLLVFLGPIFDVLGAIANVITAFVAPLAVMLLRLLTPAIRLLLAILPVWLHIADIIDGLLETLAESPFFLILAQLQIAVSIFNRVRSFLSNIWGGIKNLDTSLSDMLETLRQLPQRLSDLLPSLGGGDGGLVDRGRDFLGLGGDDGGGGGTAINIGGGLQPFVDQITRDGSVDFP